MKLVRTGQRWGKNGWGMGLQGPRALIPMAVLGLACSSLLGIEEVSEGAGAAAGDTSAGTGGKSAAGGTADRGGSSTGGNGGKGGPAGNSAGGVTSGAGGGAGTGGSSAGKGGSSGGDSGEGGQGNESATGGTAGNAGSSASGGSAGGPTDGTVRGKVINHLLHPVPNTPVMIGDTTVTTDSKGEFEVEDVAATYDVQLVVTYAHYGATAQYGWVYEGLTRRDPTLQVYGGVPLRDADFSFSATNPPSSSDTAIIALGSEYGNYAREGAGAIGLTSFSWYGPATITATAHGLVWQETNGLPTAYTTYTTSSAPFAFSDNGSTPWTLDFAPNSVSTATISGTVDTPTEDDRTNAVFVQFSSGAVIQVAAQTGSAATTSFTYLVPSLPNASVTVMASEGNAYRGAASVAHRDGITNTQSTIPLDLPTPPIPVGGQGAITRDTTISWSGSQDTYVWHAESVDWYEGVYVVTSRKSITMPTFSNGFTLRSGTECYWRVETHGQAATVDELAGPQGFADSFGASSGSGPSGPRRDSGTYSVSFSRTFTMY